MLQAKDARYLWMLKVVACFVKMLGFGFHELSVGLQFAPPSIVKWSVKRSRKEIYSGSVLLYYEEQFSSLRSLRQGDLQVL